MTKTDRRFFRAERDYPGVLIRSKSIEQMARGPKPVGARNRATAEARAAAEATGILPLDYMLSVSAGH
jgi:hypothetical protein